MATNIDPKVIATIVNAAVYSSDGASLQEIGAAFGNAPEQLKPWLDELVVERILRLDRTPKGKRYFATTAAMAYVTPTETAEPNATPRTPEAPTAGAAEGQRVGAAENQNAREPEARSAGRPNQRSDSESPKPENEGLNERDDAQDPAVSELLQLITPVVDAVTESATVGRAKPQPALASRTAVLRALADAIPQVLKALFPNGLPARLRPIIGLAAGTLVIAGLILTEWHPGTAASISVGLSVLVSGLFGARILHSKTAPDHAQKSRSDCSDVVQNPCDTTPDIHIQNCSSSTPGSRASVSNHHAADPSPDAQTAAPLSPQTPPQNGSVSSDLDTQNRPPTARNEPAIHGTSSCDSTYVQVSRRTLYLVSLGCAAAIILIAAFAWHLSRNRPTPNRDQTQRVDPTVSNPQPTATTATVGGALRPDSTPVGGALRPDSPRIKTGILQPQTVAVSAPSSSQYASQNPAETHPKTIDIPQADAPLSSTLSHATTSPAGGDSRSDSPTPEAPIVRSSRPPAATAPAAPNHPPNEPGAFARIGNQWVPLPRNNGLGIQNVQQKLTGLLTGLNRFEDAVVGKSTEPSKTPVGEVRFDGHETVPVVAADEITLAYIGPLTSFTPEQLARYPELKNYPAIELAPTVTRSDGIRTAPLYPIAASFLGFGPTRVTTATVERRAIPPFDGAAVHLATFLRCTAALPPGRYALLCGANVYELTVE